MSIISSIPGPENPKSFLGLQTHSEGNGTANGKDKMVARREAYSDTPQDNTMAKRKGTLALEERRSEPSLDSEGTWRNIRRLEKIFQLGKEDNSRIIEGGEYGHSWCYQNTNRNVIRFFLALGAPRGNKTKRNLHIPSWIKRYPICEAEFYGSFLGGELGTPIIHKRGNYLTCLEVGITGWPRFRSNRIAFLNELKEYLKRHRVATTSIYEGKSKTEGSLVFRLLIEKKMDNVLLFMMNVKINYCKYKGERLYRALSQWAMLKKKKYAELLEKGYGAEHAMGLLQLTPNSLYLLLNHFGSPSEAAT